MYEISTKETSGCASNFLAHEDLGHFEEAHRRNMQAKFYNEKFPLVYMKVTTYETLYHEDHGAYFEAQVWKKDSSIAPFYIIILFGLSLFYGLSLSFFLAFPFFYLAFFQR